MAFNDIWVDTAMSGGHVRIWEGHMTSGQTFFKGEPVSIVAAGTVTECGDDPAATAIAGIAANGPGDGAAPYAGLQQNWETGTTAVGGFGKDGQKIKVIIPTFDTFFLTQNFTSAGSAFNDVAPAIANIGDVVSLDLISGSWGLRAGGTNTICVITDVLDSLLRPIRTQGASGGTVSTTLVNGEVQYYVQFQIANHQFNR